MTLAGVDYSGGRPGGAALAAAHIHFVMRYIAHPNTGYDLTKAELADLMGHGLSVGLICERGASRALSGKLGGRYDAGLALDAANALGFPASRPIFFAVDFDASSAQQPLIDAYLDGVAAVIGIERTGVYGSVDVVERCAENSSARWFWQTLAWSGGLVSSKAHIYQWKTGSTGAAPINHAAVDYDRALKTDFGVWTPLPDSSTEPDVTTTITLTKYPGDGTRSVTGTNVTLYLPDGTTQKVATLSTIANADAEIEQSDGRAPHGTGFVRIAEKPYAGWYGIAADLKLGPVPVPVVDCSAQVALGAKAAVGKALDHVQAAVNGVNTAITEARTV